MATNLEHLARRLEGDSFFLACPLRIYAESTKLDDAQLAEKLGCSAETLTAISLCRAPTGEAAEFQRGIAQIADRFGLSVEPLTEVVRLGQAVFRMRQGASPNGLMAARDGKNDESPGSGGIP